MNDIGFGLWLALVGMTVVFSLLLVVMGVLVVLTRFDRPARSGDDPSEQRSASGAEPGEGTGGGASGSTTLTIEPRPGHGATGELTPEEIAAVSVAVIAHARVRRMQAAPAMRSHEPGSHLFASRWVAIGRSYQNQPWRRDK